MRNEVALPADGRPAARPSREQLHDLLRASPAPHNGADAKAARIVLMEAPSNGRSISEARVR